MLAVEQDRAAIRFQPDAEPHHHRHAPRPCQHGDVAGRAACRQRNAAALAPVDRQEPGRRHVVAEGNRAGGKRRRAMRRQMVQHLVANVLEIGCPGAEIAVLGGLVAGDLVLQAGAPGIVGLRALLDRGEGRTGQGLVLAAWRAGTPASRPRRRPPRRSGFPVAPMPRRAPPRAPPAPASPTPSPT